MIISQEQKDINAARELMSKSELKRVRLRRCYATLQGEESSLKAPFGLAQSHNAAPSLVDNLLRVEVAFNFQAFDNSEGKVSLFSIECSFELDYEIEPDYHPDSAAIDAFKDGNAVFNCWPYARECVQSLTSRMCVNPPPLPLLRIVPKQAPPEATAKAPTETTTALKE
jgi:hypothetical protein